MHVCKHYAHVLKLIQGEVLTKICLHFLHCENQYEWLSAEILDHGAVSALSKWYRLLLRKRGNEFLRNQLQICKYH